MQSNFNEILMCAKIQERESKWMRGAQITRFIRCAKDEGAKTKCAKIKGWKF